MGTSVPEGDHWRYEIKWDGTRMVTYYDQGTVTVYNRKQRERTHHYPELQDIHSYCMAESVILDGEMIALGRDGKPSFHEVMRRDLLTRMERIKEVQPAVPVTYMIFDVLYHNGTWVHTWPLAERLQLLEKIITPLPHIQLAAAHPDGNKLFQVMQQQNMEGIVCKDLRSAYAFGRKDDRWMKVKNYGDTVAAIGGFTLGGGFVNAVLLGQFDHEGKFWYIGHTGTGKLSKADWRQLTDLLAPSVVKERPFTNRPERHKDAYWVRPGVTVKVQFSEWRWQEGRSMRQPSIQSFVQTKAEDCKLPWL
ncbi:ATP-dependent DNA ligase [Paenibacillus gansuensis]|uniref:DNA ligase (ATP) n=1 Tax=Paenibacillus gansuensis TaxID=306542 RepID=A0ABW5P9V5_9BACL